VLIRYSIQKNDQQMGMTYIHILLVRDYWLLGKKKKERHRRRKSKGGREREKSRSREDRHRSRKI